MNNRHELTIGKLAKQAGVNVETIRYYQRIELINEPIKPESGFRKYDSNLVSTIKFIKRAQQLGRLADEMPCLVPLDRVKNGCWHSHGESASEGHMCSRQRRVKRSPG